MAYVQGFTSLNSKISSNSLQHMLIPVTTIFVLLSHSLKLILTNFIFHLEWFYHRTPSLQEDVVSAPSTISFKKKLLKVDLTKFLQFPCIF